MSIVETFTKDTLLQRVQGMNEPVAVALNLDTVTMANPVAITGARNTQLLLTGSTRPTEGYNDVLAGTRPISYNRLDLGLLFKGVPYKFDLPADNSIGSLYAFLPLFSELSGVTLTEDDVSDVKISATTEQVVVVAKPTSLNVIGRFTLILSVPPIDLSKLKGELGIFTDDTKLSDLLDFQFDGLGDRSPPFNARRLTEGYDFTAYKNILSAFTNVENVGNTASRLSSILKNEFAISWYTGNRYTVRIKDDGTWVTVVCSQQNKQDYFSLKYLK